mmetsp:Transcript_24583/g.67849  ORF Transcript_24583/g.67849 Transcript_24583/m.67849 type:complete len:520 (+) Transcript_24583:221-1780(+)
MSNDDAAMNRQRLPSTRRSVVTKGNTFDGALPLSLGRILTAFSMVFAFASVGVAAEGVVGIGSSGEERDGAADKSPSTLREDPELFPWQNCSVVLAPTGTNRNWGIFANRDFVRGEIVDISPLTVPIPDGEESVERSILNDYVYGYMRIHVPSSRGQQQQQRHRPTTPILEKLYGVLLGPDMFYNHHPVAPSVEFMTFGREPSRDLPDALNPQGFVAKRNIRAGEELFASYKGRDDGEADWFRTRGEAMQVPAQNPLSASDRRAYCSNIYAGIGLPSWRDRLLPLLPRDRSRLPFSTDGTGKHLAPFDAGWGDAKTRVDVQKGERLEISTALVGSRATTRNSALMPLVYAWADLKEDHKEALKRWEASSSSGGLLHLQYQGPDTDWKPVRHMVSDWDDLVLFPVAGSIGMVRRRRSNSDANCKLVVHPPEFLEGQLHRPVGVTVELIATRDLGALTTLVVDLDETVATPTEYQLLFRELKRTGQPFAREVFADRRRRREQQQQNNAGLSTRVTLPREEL